MWDSRYQVEKKKEYKSVIHIYISNAPILHTWIQLTLGQKIGGEWARKKQMWNMNHNSESEQHTRFALYTCISVFIFIIHFLLHFLKWRKYFSVYNDIPYCMFRCFFSTSLDWLKCERRKKQTKSLLFCEWRALAWTILDWAGRKKSLYWIIIRISF